MRQVQRMRILNGSVLLLIYVLSLYDGFIASTEPSFTKGLVRGFVLFVPALLVFLAALTTWYTRKNGGNWNSVRQNLKHNFLGLISFSWKD